VTNIDLRHLDIASNIRYNNEQNQVLMGFEGVDPEI
jgi:hypothetical protein